MSIAKRSRFEPLALLVLLFIVAAAVIWIRTVTVKETYLFFQREKELKKTEQEIQATRVQWLRLTAPRRLEAFAEKLDMHAPELQQVLKYDLEKGNPPRATP